MGFLLREVLRTLCATNNWCYAVFWKIGCQNPKLLIWEECHYEAMSSSVTSISGVDSSGLPFGEWEGSWASSKGQSSQIGILAGDRVPTLINKMMVDNQINVVGEGIVGRAAFTGKHQWIVSSNFVRHAHPPEVSNEVHNQFSAGMQTVAVIPVLPHGVVQLGSPLTVMENIGFVNDVKSLILQLGCVPGALLSDNYAAAKVSAENIRVPATFGMPVSVNSSGFSEVTNSSTSMPDSCNQLSNISQGSRLVGQSSYPPIKQVQDNAQMTASMFHTPDLVHASAKSQDNRFQPIDTSLMKLNLPFSDQLHNSVVGAEVIPSNPDAWLNQQASSCNLRFNFNHQPNNGQTGTSHSSLRLVEQQSFSNPGVQDRSSGNMSASNSCGIIPSQLRTNRGVVLNSQKEPTLLIEGREIPSGIGCHRKPTSTPKPRESADTNLYREHFAGGRFCNVDPSSKDSLAEQSSTSHVISRGFDTVHMPTGPAPRKQIREDDSLPVLSIPPIQPNDHSSLTEYISDFNTYCQKHGSGSRAAIAKYEDACGQPSSGDDLFDMLGLDYKNKLPNGNCNDLIADEVNANPQNLFKDTSVFMNMQDAGSEFYSLSNGISDSGLFSGMGSDHLLDAVVSRAQSLVKQSSDDNVSCGTTLTKISSSSIPSNSPTTGRGNRPDQVQGELFGLPKPLLKQGSVGSRSFNGCSRDDPGSCSQTSSIYGSQISSWVEQGNSMKGDPSVSTAFSKKPDDSVKSNRKRLKPGENPRPRPKDRQMIQDRVKELREIVPNGAKCSIDALLERTIKHMLFLQSVTKHADKLKQTGESKIINKEGGLLLKDNFEGGATWAFEVGSQLMVCPIIVEDLNPPRQMLVEMLCEEQGFFLEIADLIRGMGLTILKGVMEARNDKIWARFAVEANRDVTRMEIFMSLVRLLEQTVKGSASSANSIDNNNTMVHSFPQAASIPATGVPTSMQ